MKTQNTSGIGLIGIIMIVLIILKIFGLIQLSWLWILCPIWAGILLIIILLTIKYLSK